MRLKPTIKGMKGLSSPNKESKPRKTQENKLPPDEYKPMFSPMKVLVREIPSKSDPTKRIKHYVEASVKRFNDDEASPFVWLHMYQESEKYTGYMRGKTVYFPLEMLYEVLDALDYVDEECEKRHIE